MDTKEISAIKSDCKTNNRIKEGSSCLNANRRYFTQAQHRRYQRKKAAQGKKQSTGVNSPIGETQEQNRALNDESCKANVKGIVNIPDSCLNSQKIVESCRAEVTDNKASEFEGIVDVTDKKSSGGKTLAEITDTKTKGVKSLAEPSDSKSNTSKSIAEITDSKSSGVKSFAEPTDAISKKSKIVAEITDIKPSRVKDLAKITDNKSGEVDSVAEITDVKSSGVVKESTMEQNFNKSRDEVKAAREEKKKLKQMAKTGSKNKLETKGKTDNISQNNSQLNHKDVDNKIVENNHQTNNVDCVENHKQNDEKVDSPEKLNDSSIKSGEKTREEIKAEREAKKLAKQMNKSKSKVKHDESVTDINESMSAMAISTPVKADVNNKDVKSPTICVTKPDQNTSIQGDQENKESEKSKSELRAERRAKQEAQRAAKAVLQQAGVKTPKTPARTEEKKKPDVQQLEKVKQSAPSELKKSMSPEKSKLRSHEQHKVKLFDHLYVQRESDYQESPIPLNSKDIHPAIVRLGVQYASHIVMGSNARCVAFLNALKQVIVDYNLPPNVEFSRGLESHLKPCIKFLDSCRLPAVSMKNALKHIKWQLRHLPNNIAEYEAKMKLHEAIDTYVKEQIEVAGQAISLAVRKKISDGDVILTYGCSSLIEKILTEAADEKRFRVVIVAAHPWNEGRELLRRLTAKGVKCSLIMISALSFIMREINKVVLGAGALLANGYVMARAGTAQVAMVAHAFNVPVLVCCETHKFSERVQTDSIVYNEIGNPDDLINCDPSHKEGPLANWRSNHNLTLLNLTYDVTPPDLVTAVVTELAILPCTSVPVILRMKPSEFSV